MAEETKQVICQLWEENDRGRGFRREGYSLHTSIESYMHYVESMQRQFPTGSSQEQRPYEDPYWCEVPITLYEAALSRPTGLRRYDNVWIPQKLGNVQIPKVKGPKAKNNNKKEK